MRQAFQRYFRTGAVEWPIQLTAVLCREMSWTYEEYLDQPQEFILMLFELLRAESRLAKSAVQ